MSSIPPAGSQCWPILNSTALKPQLEATGHHLSPTSEAPFASTSVSKHLGHAPSSKAFSTSTGVHSPIPEPVQFCSDHFEAYRTCRLLHGTSLRIHEIFSLDVAVRSTNFGSLFNQPLTTVAQRHQPLMFLCQPFPFLIFVSRPL